MNFSLFSLALLSSLLAMPAISKADIINGDDLYNGPSAPLKQSPEPQNSCSSGTLSSYQPGSIIDCRDQTLFQSVPITGTAFSLNYSSRSQPATESLGRTIKMNIEKYSADQPTRFGTLRNVKASVNIRGRVFEQVFQLSPEENLTVPFVFDFTWDGNDSNGQKVSGLVKTEVRIEYNYEGLPDKGPQTVFVSKKVTFGTVDASLQNLGGWSISQYHSFQPLSGNIALGSGLRLPIENLRHNPSYIPGSNGVVRVPSMDTSEIYHFIAEGLHIATADALTGVIKYNFQHNSQGHLVSITDRNGLVTTLERDVAGNIIAIVGPFGARTTVSVDSDGLISEIVDPMGKARKFTYATGSQKGLMTSYTDPMGRVKEYAFSPEGLLISASDFKGSIKRLTREEGTTTSYGSLTQTVKHFSPLGRITTYETEQYEGAIRLRNIEPSGRMTSIQVMPQYFHKSSSSNDGRSSTTWSTPDPRFPERIYPSQTENYGISGSKITYTRNYNLLDPTDPYSLSTYTFSMNLDGIGTYSSTFDKAAMKQTDATPSGRSTVRLFDAKGQLVESRAGNLTPATYTYNQKGLLTRITQGTRITRFTYNGRGLLATATNPLGEVEHYTYNGKGLMTSQTQANGDVYRFTYNANGMLRNITMPDERVYTQSYNVNSYPTVFREPTIDENDYFWRAQYNFDNDMTRYRLPDQTLMSWTYDPQGRVASETGPSFQKVYGYSPVGLLTSIQWSPADRLIIDGDSEYLRSLTWEGETKGKVSYVWGTFGRLQTLRINNQYAAGFMYTKEGEVSRVISPSATLELTHTTDTGLLSGSTVGSISTQQSYNSFGEMTNLSARIGSTNLASFSYSRDALGRITGITSPIGLKAFAYDTKGQLVSTTENGNTQTFAYTSNGNRLTANGQEIYDTQERLVSDSNWAYTYGRNGQLQRKDHRSNGSSVQYVYDSIGNLLSVKTADGQVVEYKSDGLDRRLSRRVNGQFSHGFLYQDQLRPLAQVDQNGAVIASFIYGSRSNSPDLMYKDGFTYRFIHDHLGSIIFVVNTTSNQVVQALTYDIWGNVLSDSNPGFQPFGFAGGLYDSTTGLVRFGARDYDASIGRWLNKDPIKLQGGWNLYAYASSDPVNNIDPDGLKVITGNYVLSDKIISALQRVNEYFPDQNVIVTGGNRYRDNFGQVRSSTNDTIIPNSAIYSKHIQGVAVDFIVTNVPNELASEAASQVFDWVDGKYKEGPHVHADFGGKGGARNICK